MPKRNKPAKPGERKQYNLAFTGDAPTRIDETAEALGLEPTQLLRMIVLTNLPTFERQAKDVRDGKIPGGAH